jgi:hypothetical protein
VTRKNKKGDQLQKEIHSSFSCFDVVRSRMAAEVHAIKTVFITMFGSSDCFIPAKILGV